MKKYKEESKKNVDTTRDASAGILDYYWGTSIHKIFRYEINFYYNYIISCPKGDSQTINAALHDREDKLMQLLLTKSYDPRDENKLYHNPYFFVMKPGYQKHLPPITVAHIPRQLISTETIGENLFNATEFNIHFL